MDLKLSDVNSLNEYFLSDSYYTVGMTSVQMDNFIFDHQLTDIRKARQLVLELEARFASIQEHTIQSKREAIEMEGLQDDLAKLESDGEDTRLKLLDIEELAMKINLTERRLRGDQYSIDSIIATTNRFEESIGKNLADIELENDDDEREYWIKRMANQAGLDLASIGQISTGNMTSILQLPEDDIPEVFGKALALAHTVKREVSNMDTALLDNINEQAMLDIRKELLGNVPPTKTLKDATNKNIKGKIG